LAFFPVVTVTPLWTADSPIGVLASRLAPLTGADCVGWYEATESCSVQTAHSDALPTEGNVLTGLSSVTGDVWYGTSDGSGMGVSLGDFEFANTDKPDDNQCTGAVPTSGVVLGGLPAGLSCTSAKASYSISLTVPTSTAAQVQMALSTPAVWVASATAGISGGDSPVFIWSSTGVTQAQFYGW